MAVSGDDRPGGPALECLSLGHSAWIGLSSLPGSPLMENQVAAGQLVRGRVENHSPAQNHPKGV